MVRIVMPTIVVNKYFANITTYSVGLREQFWELVFYALQLYFKYVPNYFSWETNEYSVYN